MDKFTAFRSVVAPLDRANVDTDAIIPKQFLKSVKRSGFGPNLFDEWRYLDKGEPGLDCSQRPENPDFVLNQPEYRQAQILLARKNFGCGSSREHAPWALQDFGIKVIIAPSFADIFYNNCFKNGVLPIVLCETTVDELFEKVNREHLFIDVNLEAQTLTLSTKEVISFDVEAGRKHSLLNGLDDIGETLQHLATIDHFEQRHQNRFPWLFQSEAGESL